MANGVTDMLPRGEHHGRSTILSSSWSCEERFLGFNPYLGILVGWADLERSEERMREGHVNSMALCMFGRWVPPMFVSSNTYLERSLWEWSLPAVG
ncbi:hypothetical protein MUK42_05570 [Musa troglodytarum]|uniref:Uncharacterized protein n=1 Tax=Musa troglodytarum TaxID=320322 RepID=A0A9E7GRC5_9LILI|nr:hypothetical protein MUK42_05570 [Musa troglodytarum]